MLRTIHTIIAMHTVIIIIIITSFNMIVAGSEVIFITLSTHDLLTTRFCSIKRIIYTVRIR